MSVLEGLEHTSTCNPQTTNPENAYRSGPTKIKMGFLEDGTKVRIAKTSGAIIPKPDFSHVTAEKPNGLEKDTEPHVVQKVTVSEEDAELHRRLRDLQLAGKITSPTR
jgi:hypothetical protein